MSVPLARFRVAGLVEDLGSLTEAFPFEACGWEHEAMDAKHQSIAFTAAEHHRVDLARKCRSFRLTLQEKTGRGWRLLRLGSWFPFPVSGDWFEEKWRRVAR